MVNSDINMLRLPVAIALAIGGNGLKIFCAHAEPAAHALPVAGVKSNTERAAVSDVDVLHHTGTLPAGAVAQVSGRNASQAPTSAVAKVDRVSELSALMVTGVNTKSVDLRALLRPGTIIHFWASWCQPCATEIPELERFYRHKIVGELMAKGIRLITISNDRTVTPAVRFIRRYRTTFPVYLDRAQTSNLTILGQRALPSTVLVDGDGRFHRLALGKLDWDYPDLPRILTAMTARKSVPRNTTKPPAD